MKLKLFLFLIFYQIFPARGETTGESLEEKRGEEIIVSLPSVQETKEIDIKRENGRGIEESDYFEYIFIPNSIGIFQ
jgi:hypothetical protein